MPLHALAHGAVPGRPAGGTGARLARLRARLLALVPDTLALGGLAAMAVVFFWPAISGRMIAFENDTRIFYFPLFVRLADALKTGQLPLWSSQLFGGYPLFADGETGSLYPFHLLTLLFLPVETAFSWLRPLRFFQAAAGAYLFCRTVRINRSGAVVGALVFAFGGFAVAQMHHTNISTAAVWLPLILTFAELALRGSGRTRYAFVLLAGVAFGLQGLIVHVQIVLMTALLFAAFCGYRCIVGPVGAGPGPASMLAGFLVRRFGIGQLSSAPAGARASVVWAAWGRPVLAAAVVALAGSVGGALAAVQLLPLYELGTFSFRGSGVDYSFASQYSLPPVQLISLLLPDFFVANGRYWGLWSRWEVFLYVGIAPLVLALYGALISRRRLALFFLAVGAASLVVAFGDYSPFGIHRALATLPGFSALRAPGRFAYLVTFSVAMLAALGTHALARDLRHPESGPAAGERRGEPALARRAALRRALGQGGTAGVVLGGAVLLLAHLAAAAAPLALTLASAFVEANKDTTMAWLQATFVRMRGFDTRWTAEQLYQALAASLDIAQPSTLRQVALLLGVTALLFAWDRLRALRPLWQTLLVVLVAVDFVVLGRGFHPTVPYGALDAPSGAVEFLAAQPGLYRVFSQKGSRDEPNRLLSFDIAEANGYASLEPDRHTQLAVLAEYAPNRLLDLLNVRYYVVKNQFEALPSFGLTSFRPGRPLLSSTSRNPAGAASYALPTVPATSVRVVSTLRWSTAVPQGTDVAELTATDAGGAKLRFRLQAGVHTAEWAWRRPDLAGKVAHQIAPVAYTSPAFDGSGRRFDAHYYYAEFALPGRTRLTQIDVRFLHPTAQVELFGLATFDDESKEVEQLELSKLRKFQRVYSDQEVVIYENADWLPRAFLVPAAEIVRPGNEIVARMASGDWDPTRLVLIEGQFDLSKLAPPASAPAAPVTFDAPHATDVRSGPGRVHILRTEPERVRLDVSATAPAMLFLADLDYPGWRATVDGRDTPIYRANYLFRAVHVPAGQHTVEFVYQPRSFRLGLFVTVAATALVVAALALLGFGRPRWRWGAGRSDRGLAQPWRRSRDSATIASPGTARAPVESVHAPTGGARKKGVMSDGRQESEGHRQEEPAEASVQDQEGGEVTAGPLVR
jgi:hypothetical protein